MGVPLLQRLKGDLFLGYQALVAYPLRTLRSGDPRVGKEKFLANYGPEGLIPTSLDDRKVLGGASRCVHCGLCELFVPGASLLPVVYARATPNLRRARSEFAGGPPPSFHAAEQVCPTRVPLGAIFAYIRRTLEVLPP